MDTIARVRVRVVRVRVRAREQGTFGAVEFFLQPLAFVWPQLDRSTEGFDLPFGFEAEATGGGWRRQGGTCSMVSI